MNINPILRADSYKSSHYLQYPPGTEYVSNYIESRGGQADHTVFFGLQILIKDYLATPITHSDVDEAREFMADHFGDRDGVMFNEKGWRHIVNRHNGFAPLKIEALPEGTTIGTKNVLMQMVNTDPECFWLPGYLETKLLRAAWYATTVATKSATFKGIMQDALNRTSDNPDVINFMLHDFGGRGVSSGESAAIGGAAHLVNFMGSDTMEGIYYARHFYHEHMAGFSIAAAEHSTITSWGRDGELQSITNILDQFLKPGKTVAIVSDSYDLWNVVDNYFGTLLKDRIMKSGGRVVVRPDSGDPVEVAPEVVERLMKHYGYTVNSKGYRVLPDCIRVIQGDGVSPQTVTAILAEMERRKISAENIVFGAGGELLQKMDRDTQKFADKAACIYRNGVWLPFAKDPITDPGKKSKAGRFAVIMEDNIYKTVLVEEVGPRKNELVIPYNNGPTAIDWTFREVRERAAAGAWHFVPGSTPTIPAPGVGRLYRQDATHG